MERFLLFYYDILVATLTKEGGNYRYIPTDTGKQIANQLWAPVFCAADSGEMSEQDFPQFLRVRMGNSNRSTATDHYLCVPVPENGT